MNWEAISAIGEAVGAIAVVISLVYLAVQIRQNTRQIASSMEATQLAAFERNIESGNRVREFFLLNPSLAELYGRGRQSYSDLNPSDKVKFELMLRNVFSEVHGAFIRQHSISHDPEGFEGLSKVIDGIVSANGVREFLHTKEPDWRPEFRKFVYERLAILEKKNE